MSPDPTALPRFADVEAAAQRIGGAVIRTPLLENERVNRRLGGRLIVKPEVLQRTGSFKFRGAYNFISQLDPQARARGVVAWSSGNHAQGVAEAARLLGAPAAVIMPNDAPPLKIANTRASGAEVILYDRVREDREEIARRIAAERGATPMPPYDHPWIIAGQGTVGLELAAQLKEMGTAADAVLVPCSGGGFVAGVALALSGVSPATEVWSAEPAQFDDMKRSLDSGSPERNAALTGSICDALLAPTPGKITFALARKLLAGGTSVTDDETRQAMELAYREFKIVVEPGGAVALAAALAGRIPVRGRTVAVMCSGGNADPAIFAAALCGHAAAPAA